LCEFGINIKNIKGKENKFVDALSRRMHAMHVGTIRTLRLDLKSGLLEFVGLDEHYL
jgi:hypothetical protein